MTSLVNPCMFYSILLNYIILHKMATHQTFPKSKGMGASQRRLAATLRYDFLLQYSILYIYNTHYMVWHVFS